MTKKERELIFNKYNGKCAYCGCELKKGFHAISFFLIFNQTTTVGSSAVKEG